MQRHFVIKTDRGEIVIRPQREDEEPFYGPYRFVVLNHGHPIVLMVRKKGRPELRQALRFEPEEKWKRCLHCGKTDWSAWMPVQLAWCDAPDGIPGREYPYAQWFVICIHCFGVADLCVSGPCAEDEGEYLFDPNEEPKHLTLPGWQKNQRRTR